MKYELTIEGGFAGIHKDFKGEIDLGEHQNKEMFNLLETSQQPPNELLRDGLVYQLRLENKDQILHTAFDDSNLPKEVRSLIDIIMQKK